MAMVTSNRTSLLNSVKPFKTTWVVEVKVLHSWTQTSNYAGGETLQFILADKTGVKIHCTCKRHFFPRVKKLQVGQWRFIENFSVTPAGGKYRPTRHEYKISITNHSNVTDSSLKNDDIFLSLTAYPDIINGSLDSNFLIDVIGQAIDIGDMQVVPVQGKETKKLELTLTDTDDHQIACCLWGRFAEHVYYAYKVGQRNQNFLCLLRFAKINVYKGQVQITSAFETSTLEINPSGFDVQDYQRLMSNNDELALTTGTREVVKPKGNKRQPDKWSLYPERTILDIIMATEVEKCIVKATVYAIDTDWAWYYFGCVNCHLKKVTNITKKDIVPVKHLWYCDSCKQSVNNVAPQFKLHLLIKDDTGETKVMLLDTIAEPIVGVSAEVLLDGSLEEVEDPEDLPDAINELIGKTFKFGVYVSKENVGIEIVLAAMNSSYLWEHCKVLKLTKNMRLSSNNLTDEEAKDLKEFSEWILAVGDGRIAEPNDGEALIDIPEEFLIMDPKDPIETICHAIYGDTDSLRGIKDPKFFQQRAILCPTNEDVNMINDHMLSKLDGEEMIYTSSDSIDPSDTTSVNNDALSSDFLNSIKVSGLPNHSLRLKIGCPVMLLRNINPNEGLMNGTRLQITQLMDFMVEARILTGKKVGETAYIPRLLITPTDKRLPFKMRRRQLPLAVAFAITINKSQGQSLSQVGLFLPRPVFSHGQLYVAISRVTSKKGLKVLIVDKDGKPQRKTTNVVFKEIFSNLENREE